MDKWTCKVCNDGEEVPAEDLHAHFRRFHPSQFEESLSKAPLWADGTPVTFEEFDTLGDVDL